MSALDGLCEGIYFNRDSEYVGLPCECIRCFPDGWCIDFQNGGGCAACDGPVKGCEMWDKEDGLIPFFTKEGKRIIGGAQ